MQISEWSILQNISFIFLCLQYSENKFVLSGFNTFVLGSPVQIASQYLVYNVGINDRSLQKFYNCPDILRILSRFSRLMLCNFCTLLCYYQILRRYYVSSGVLINKSFLSFLFLILWRCISMNGNYFTFSI